jgi:hypothetical protein
MASPDRDGEQRRRGLALVLHGVGDVEQAASVTMAPGIASVQRDRGAGRDELAADRQALGDEIGLGRGWPDALAETRWASPALEG